MTHSAPVTAKGGGPWRFARRALHGLTPAQGSDLSNHENQVGGAQGSRPRTADSNGRKNWSFYAENEHRSTGDGPLVRSHGLQPTPPVTGGSGRGPSRAHDKCVDACFQWLCTMITSYGDSEELSSQHVDRAIKNDRESVHTIERFFGGSDAAAPPTASCSDMGGALTSVARDDRSTSAMKGTRGGGGGTWNGVDSLGCALRGAMCTIPIDGGGEHPDGGGHIHPSILCYIKWHAEDTRFASALRGVDQRAASISVPSGGMNSSLPGTSTGASMTRDRVARIHVRMPGAIERLGIEPDLVLYVTRIGTLTGPITDVRTQVVHGLMSGDVLRCVKSSLLHVFAPLLVGQETKTCHAEEGERDANDCPRVADERSAGDGGRPGQPVDDGEDMDYSHGLTEKDTAILMQALRCSDALVGGHGYTSTDPTLVPMLPAPEAVAPRKRLRPSNMGSVVDDGGGISVVVVGGGGGGGGDLMMMENMAHRRMVKLLGHDQSKARGHVNAKMLQFVTHISEFCGTMDNALYILSGLPTIEAPSFVRDGERIAGGVAKLREWCNSRERRVRILAITDRMYASIHDIVIVAEQRHRDTLTDAVSRAQLDREGDDVSMVQSVEASAMVRRMGAGFTRALLEGTMACTTGSVTRMGQLQHCTSHSLDSLSIVGAAGSAGEARNWAQRRASLSILLDRLNGPHIRSLLRMARLIPEFDQERWNALDAALTDAVNESKDNVRYLESVAKLTEAMWVGGPVAFVRGLPQVFRAIAMVRDISKYYSDPVRVVCLCASLVNKCVIMCYCYMHFAEVDGDGVIVVGDEYEAALREMSEGETSISGLLADLLLRQSRTVFRKKLLVCMKLYRNILGEFAQIKEALHLASSEDFIFANFRAVADRMQKLLDLSLTTEQFFFLSQTPVEGLEPLVEDFNRVYDKLCTKRCDPLHPMDTSFESHYLEMLTDLFDAEERHKATIESFLQASRSPAVYLLRLEYLKSLFTRESLVNFLEAKYFDAIRRFQELVDHIADLYHSNKHDPPVARNMPHMAGVIHWARHLLHKLEEAMALLKQHATYAMESDYGKTCTQSYAAVIEELNAFEAGIYEQWESSAVESVRRMMNATVLSDNGGVLSVNPTLFVSRNRVEARMLRNLGFDVPTPILQYCLYGPIVTAYNRRLQIAVHDVLDAQDRVPQVTEEIMRVHMSVFMKTALPGAQSVTWGSAELLVYVEDVERTASRYCFVVGRVERAVDRVRRLLERFCTFDLFAVPEEGETWDLNKFIWVHRERAIVTSFLIDTLNLAIERAVGDLCVLLKGFPGIKTAALSDVEIEAALKDIEVANERMVTFFEDLVGSLVKRVISNGIAAMHKRFAASWLDRSASGAFSFYTLMGTFLRVLTIISGTISLRKGPKDQLQVVSSPTTTQIQQAINVVAKIMIAVAGGVYRWGQRAVGTEHTCMRVEPDSAVLKRYWNVHDDVVQFQYHMQGLRDRDGNEDSIDLDDSITTSLAVSGSMPPAPRGLGAAAAAALSKGAIAAFAEGESDSEEDGGGGGMDASKTAPAVPFVNVAAMSHAMSRVGPVSPRRQAPGLGFTRRMQGNQSISIGAAAQQFKLTAPDAASRCMRGLDVLRRFVMVGDNDWRPLTCTYGVAPVTIGIKWSESPDRVFRSFLPVVRDDYGVFMAVIRLSAVHDVRRRSRRVSHGTV